MSDHGFIDPEAPMRHRISALEAQVAALAEADRRPEFDSGEYFTFTHEELDARDTQIRSEFAAECIRSIEGMATASQYGPHRRAGIHDAAKRIKRLVDEDGTR